MNQPYLDEGGADRRGDDEVLQEALSEVTQR